MFDGQVLFKGCTIYSPWMQRGGDSLRATLEVAYCDYQGDFQSLVRAVLRALGHPGSEARRSLTDALKRACAQ